MCFKRLLYDSKIGEDFEEHFSGDEEHEYRKCFFEFGNRQGVCCFCTKWGECDAGDDDTGEGSEVYVTEVIGWKVRLIEADIDETRCAD